MRWMMRERHKPRFGSPGNNQRCRYWIPACAGMTKQIAHE